VLGIVIILEFEFLIEIALSQHSLVITLGFVVSRMHFLDA